MLSLQDIEGDNKVVNIIEDWDVLAEYAGEKLGFYQILGTDGTIEIRVQTGRLGFKKEVPGPGRRQPFFEAAEYKCCIESADLAKLAKLIRIVGMLLQTKVYLFWIMPNEKAKGK